MWCVLHALSLSRCARGTGGAFTNTSGQRGHWGPVSSLSAQIENNAKKEKFIKITTNILGGKRFLSGFFANTETVCSATNILFRDK
jgi:hypothetical protein